MIKGLLQQENINSNYTGTYHQSTQIHKTNSILHKKRYGQSYNNYRGLQHPLATLDRSARQKIHKRTLYLNWTLDQMDLIDAYIIFYPTAAEYNLFSSALWIFCNVDNILGHKSHLNKFFKVEVTSNILLDHCGIKLEMNFERNSLYKYTKIKQSAAECSLVPRWN